MQRDVDRHVTLGSTQKDIRASLCRVPKNVDPDGSDQYRQRQSDHLSPNRRFAIPRARLRSGRHRTDDRERDRGQARSQTPLEGRFGGRGGYPLDGPRQGGRD
jgi:hypothetical protein